MPYFLKKSKIKRGTYLQIYESYYDPAKRGTRNRSAKALGYVEDLRAKGIADPVKWGREQAEAMNAAKAPRPQIGERSASANAGWFLVKSMLDYLGFDDDMRRMTASKGFRFDFPGFFKAMVAAQVVSPGSKLRAWADVVPSMYGCGSYSYDQILDGIEYIGSDYEKYVEMANWAIGKRWKRDFSSVLFDCTNYYFEVDLEDGLRRKGPSKEGRKDPIVGQALMLDKDQIPCAMRMFPGNESERPKIREMVEDMKARYGLEGGRVVQIADKGLNCARNIYAAVKEAKDGYIFSKSVHGRALSGEEKKWVLLRDGEANRWTDVEDGRGGLLYSYKSCVDDFEYACDLDGDGRDETRFKVREKRLVTYNPELARKRRREILREVEKARRAMSLKAAAKEDLGDAAKYLSFGAVGENGGKAEITAELNEAKVKEDMDYAGYNMLVTSECGASDRDIYEAYHQLWKIEESFRVLKTYLEARPVFLQKEESILGHFTVCYWALVVLRLLELKVFRGGLSAGQIVDFVRDFNVTDTGMGFYTNQSTASSTHKAVKKAYGLSHLGDLHLRKKDLDNIMAAEVPD